MGKIKNLFIKTGLILLVSALLIVSRAKATETDNAKMRLAQVESTQKFMRVLVNLYFGDPWKPQKFFAVLDRNVLRWRENELLEEMWHCDTNLLPGGYRFRIYLNDPWARDEYLNRHERKERWVLSGGLVKIAPNREKTGRYISSFSVQLPLNKDYLEWNFENRLDKPVYYSLNVSIFIKEETFKRKQREWQLEKDVTELKCDIATRFWADE